MNDRELRVLARKVGSNPATLEKDYALTWLLRGFYLEKSRLRDAFVLKGGTAIRKAYFPDRWRFSEDLDFTVTKAVIPEQAREATQWIFDELMKESGIRYELEAFHSNEGAIICTVKFTGPLNHKNKIKLDVSLTEKMVLQPEWRSIKTTFPGMPEFKILAYSLLEILTEKIRSIMQRGYSRDYYDVWRLTKENDFDEKEVKELLMRKCELKGIDYDPELFFNRDRLKGAKDHWIAGLGHLTKELPDFDTVISELRPKLAFLLV